MTLTRQLQKWTRKSRRRRRKERVVEGRKEEIGCIVIVFMPHLGKGFHFRIVLLHTYMGIIKGTVTKNELVKN